MNQGLQLLESDEREATPTKDYSKRCFRCHLQYQQATRFLYDDCFIQRTTGVLVEGKLQEYELLQPFR